MSLGNGPILVTVTDEDDTVAGILIHARFEEDGTVSFPFVFKCAASKPYLMVKYAAEDKKCNNGSVITVPQCP